MADASRKQIINYAISLFFPFLTFKKKISFYFHSQLSQPQSWFSILMNVLLVVMKLQLNKKFSISSLTVFLLHSLLAVVLKKPYIKTYSLICCVCCVGVGCFYATTLLFRHPHDTNNVPNFASSFCSQEHQQVSFLQQKQYGRAIFQHTDITN